MWMRYSSRLMPPTKASALLTVLGACLSTMVSSMMPDRVSGIYTMRSRNSGNLPLHDCSNSMHMARLTASTASISQMDEPFMLRLSFTHEPMLMPMRKMGMRLKKISRCPTLWCTGG